MPWGMERTFNPLIVTGCFAVGSLILAYEPLHWLARSWASELRNPTGPLIALACVALMLWSVTSPGLAGVGNRAETSVLLLILAAILRLAAQLLDINIIGGAALAIDIFALARLAGLDRRVRAISPFWLAVLFLFTMPVERIIQRMIGFPLQKVSAFGAHRLLDLILEVQAIGLRLIVEGRDVLVDLPCSGSAGIMLAGAFFTALASVLRAPFVNACLWGFATLCFCVFCNALRISLLSLGIVYEDALGINVMAQPAHNLIGLFTLSLSILPALLWFRPAPILPRGGGSLPRRDLRSCIGSSRPRLRTLGAGPAVAFVICATAIVSLTPRPTDVSGPVIATPMPAQLLGHRSAPVPLSAQEAQYFATYGGTAKKAQFGPMGVTYVTTTSPLRHLHSPDVCLSGLGFEVTFRGTRYEPVPTAVYHAIGPDGAAWELAVSFIGPSGQISPGIAEMAWHWLNGARGQWASVQRITPLGMPSVQAQKLEASLLAALDIHDHFDRGEHL